MAGVLVTTVSAVIFIALVVAILGGLFDHPYAGLVVFVLVPALFVLGLLLIPLGMWLEWRRLQRQPDAVRDWPIIDLRSPATRRWALLVAVLTTVNVLIVTLAAKGTVRWMDSPEFCGQTCHLPMHPQFTAWQDAPHAEVTCTQCHVGEGARALIHYKLAGARQLYHVVTNQIPKPIPAVADMRPARETCGTCHWSGRDPGTILKVKKSYADDAANSETIASLEMLVGGPGRKTASGRAIHWHADPNVRIEFVSTDPERQTIPYVRVTDRNGAVTEYRTEGTTDDQITGGHRRTMDCIDCHNVAAHRIAPTPEQAVDEAIAADRISRSLPFIRREAVKAVKADHATQEEGAAAIDKGLRGFYAGQTVDQEELASAIRNVQLVYRRNVFPAMKVTFGVYPDNIGHITSSGCFRCHDGGHTASDGRVIGADCEYCHIQK
jgi:hypothetical protein